MPPESPDQIVRDFLDKDEGVIVYLSDDFVFTRALRNIVSRVIGLRGETLLPYSSTEAALNKCLELRDDEIPCVVFVERMIGNMPSTDFIIRLKREFPAVTMIVLTWEATQETVAYFFELGVSRVLVKPASANKVIEELAGAIAPPVELKQHLARCTELLDKREYDEALEASDRILMIRPDSARGLVLRGDALMGVGRTDSAIQCYMAAHEAKPIFMAPIIRLAGAFRDMEDERALAYLKELDDISPLNPERKVDIAEHHLKQGEHDKAEEYLDRGISVAEREASSIVGDLTQRIVDAVSAIAPNLAVKYLNRVIDTKRVLGRDDLVHFNRLGIILRGEGRWEEAVEVYKKALTIAPEDPVIHYNMGLALWEGSQRSRAMDSFENALRIDPGFYIGSVGAALNIGSLYFDLRQQQDAVPFFEHVLDIDPDNSLARAKLDEINDKTQFAPVPTPEEDFAMSLAQDDEILDLDTLPEPPKKKKKKKKRRPFTNLEL